MNMQTLSHSKMQDDHSALQELFTALEKVRSASLACDNLGYTFMAHELRFVAKKLNKAITENIVKINQLPLF